MRTRVGGGARERKSWSASRMRAAGCQVGRCSLGALRRASPPRRTALVPRHGGRSPGDVGLLVCPRCGERAGCWRRSRIRSRSGRCWGRWGCRPRFRCFCRRGHRRGSGSWSSMGERCGRERRRPSAESDRQPGTGRGTPRRRPGRILGQHAVGKEGPEQHEGMATMSGVRHELWSKFVRTAESGSPCAVAPSAQRFRATLDAASPQLECP